MGLKEGIYETCPHCRKLVFLIKDKNKAIDGDKIVRGECACGALIANIISPLHPTVWDWVMDNDFKWE